MRKILYATLAATALTFAMPAAAQVQCQNTDITVPGGTVLDCAGFVYGNPINSGGGEGIPGNGLSANEEQMAALLLELGFVYNGDSNGIEQVFSNSNPLINFNTLLTGNTIIGVHYGNGQGSPGRPAGSPSESDDTAFYLFNAGAGVDMFTLNFNSSSTVTLFQTGGNSVPEPGTWAMMLLGFGAAGAAMRRRRRFAMLPQIA